MDVRNANDKPPIVEHGETCFSYFMVEKESVRDKTTGGYLEFVAEFELKPGTKLEPHYHDTEEFYHILRGRAMMWIEGERRELNVGDTVWIPRNQVHSIWSADDDEPFRAFAFAVSYMPRGEAHYVACPERTPELD